MSILQGEIWLTDQASNRLAMVQLSLLRAIGETGSISSAAKSVGISYKTAWERLDRLNNISKSPLVLRATGGSKGGGTQLTEYGKKILQGFEKFQQHHQEFLQGLNDQVQSLDDIGGFVRHSSMQVSARNRFLGTIGSIKIGDVNAEISLDITESLQIIAMVTVQSVENMGLATSDSVLAMIKASSVTLAVGESIVVSARNKFLGPIAEIHRGSVNSDVSISLGDGKTLSAMVTNHSAEKLGLRKSLPVFAFFKASSVILMRA